MRRVRLAVVVAASAGIGIAWVGPAMASASATDYVNAIVVNTTDIANAAVSASVENINSPDISCATPTAEGTVVTPATDAHPVGTLDGNDVANGTGVCISLQQSSFGVTLVTQIEYLVPGTHTFAVIPGCLGRTMQPATAGVGEAVNPLVSCNYTATSVYAGQPHRVHSILTTTLTTNVYNGYSPVYNGGAGSISVS